MLLEKPPDEVRNATVIPIFWSPGSQVTEVDIQLKWMCKYLNILRAKCTVQYLPWAVTVFPCCNETQNFITKFIKPITGPVHSFTLYFRSLSMLSSSCVFIYQMVSFHKVVPPNLMCICLSTMHAYYSKIFRQHNLRHYGLANSHLRGSSCSNSHYCTWPVQ
jgi:hypothetical protein